MKKMVIKSTDKSSVVRCNTSVKANIDRLLILLSDGEFYSGEYLAKELGVTRTAIWKLIKKLKSWQLNIYSVRGRGYKIPGGIELLDGSRLREDLKLRSSHFNRIDILTSIDSTADYLSREWQLNRGKGIVCVAEHQTAGRGRKGRGWTSPFAANLYFSIGVSLPLGMTALGGFSLAIGMSLAKILNKMTAQKIKLKWPNDLVFEGKKLAGILVEASGDSNDSSFLNIGVGLNWDMHQNQGGVIDQPWVNLKDLLAVEMTRNQVLVNLLSGVDEAIERYLTKGFKGFYAEWKALSALILQPVSIHLAHSVVSGVEVGIEESGAIQIKTASGIETFHSGEVSLRKNSDLDG